MLKGRSALVTGSVGGLGAAIARELAAQGCNVMLSGFGEAADIERQRAALAGEHGVDVRYHGADLRDVSQIEDMVATTADAFGGVDILVNNAVYRFYSPIEKFPPEQWDQAVAVNMTAPFHMIRLSLPHMRARGWGRIVNLSSIRAIMATANRPDYVTTKTALLGLTRSVAMEVLGTSITCNALLPSSVLTPHSDRGIRKLMEDKGLSRQEAEREYLKGRGPVGRFIDPAHIAQTITFLCSEAGGEISGVAIPLDGGRTAGEGEVLAPPVLPA